MSTTIEWCRNPDGSYGKTWNPVTGCSPASLGCKNCYAKRMAQRLKGRFGYPVNDPFKVTLHPDKLNYPLSLKQSNKIFVCSMGDLFHPDVPFEFIDSVFAVMSRSQHHIYLVLTKRPMRMAEYLKADRYLEILKKAKGIKLPQCWKGDAIKGKKDENLWSHVWLGTTIVIQAEADVNLPILLSIPGHVHFVSIEPMLEAIDLIHVKWWPATEHYIDVLRCGYWHPIMDFISYSDMQRIDWVIAGGETGPGAIPIHPEWIRGLRDQCQAANMPFFFKSWGEWKTVYDRDTDDPDWQRCLIPKNNRERYLNLEGGYGFHGDRIVFIRRIGRKTAGRMLDGREWNQFPVLT